MSDLTIMPENYDNIRTGIVELLNGSCISTSFVTVRFVISSVLGFNANFAQHNFSVSREHASEPREADAAQTCRE